VIKLTQIQGIYFDNVRLNVCSINQDNFLKEFFNINQYTKSMGCRAGGVFPKGIWDDVAPEFGAKTPKKIPSPPRTRKSVEILSPGCSYRARVEIKNKVIHGHEVPNQN
jgi:hypothetical protein